MFHVKHFFGFYFSFVKIFDKDLNDRLIKDTEGTFLIHIKITESYYDSLF